MFPGFFSDSWKAGVDTSHFQLILSCPDPRHWDSGKNFQCSGLGGLSFKSEYLWSEYWSGWETTGNGWSTNRHFTQERLSKFQFKGTHSWYTPESTKVPSLRITHPLLFFVFFIYFVFFWGWAPRSAPLSFVVLVNKTWFEYFCL